MESLDKLRIFDIYRQGSHALGPGCRYVIWTQGCQRHCQGCLTPESQPLSGGVEVSVEALAADIILNAYIDGITISGGEPMLQAGALAAVLQQVHKHRPELSVIVYTGATFETLEENSTAMELLEHVDILIDGEYVESKNDGQGIRGSSNQRIIPITNRLDTYIEQMKTGIRHVERVANSANTYTSIGIPPRINKKEFDN